MGTLTVRENLMFSANLRLPSSLSKKDKRQRVEETLQELGLTSCADTKVSHIYLRRGGYLLVGFHCVCMYVCKISQKVVNGF